MTRRVLITLLVMSLLEGAVFAQQPRAGSGESHKHRTILTVVGAGGGFAAGVFVGLSLFDDAINSDRKVWGTAVIGAAAGGVGGYFIGRTIDRSRRGTAVVTVPLGDNNLAISPIATPSGKGVQLAFQF